MTFSSSPKLGHMLVKECVDSSLWKGGFGRRGAVPRKVSHDELEDGQHPSILKIVEQVESNQYQKSMNGIKKVCLQRETRQTRHLKVSSHGVVQRNAEVTYQAIVCTRCELLQSSIGQRDPLPYSVRIEKDFF
jgi:hypothetical protein